jgi:hypothetical protein
MVGAARFLPPGPADAARGARSGVSGVVRLSAMRLLGESAHPTAGK